MLTFAVLCLLLALATTATSARVPAWKQAWQYKWEVWLPDKWARIGACETGYGKRPGNWAWDSGTYVSAFGIYRQGYRSDARAARMPDWPTRGRDGRYTSRIPTPWQQFMTALAHYRLHGGFSGWGCRNA